MGFSETGECVVIIFMIMRWLCLAVHLYPWNRLLKKVVWKRACGLEDGCVAVFFSPLFLFRLLCLLQQDGFAVGLLEAGHICLYYLLSLKIH